MRRLALLYGFAIACNLTGVLIGVLAGTPGTTPIDFGSEPAFTVQSIFLHNAGIALTIAVGGVLFGGPTVLLLVLGGVPLGVGIDLGLDPLYIIPHGVFEFPAIWSAGAAGFVFPVSVIDRYRNPSGRPRDDWRLFFALAVTSIVLFAIAAIVEVTVTPRLFGV